MFMNNVSRCRKVFAPLFIAAVFSTLYGCAGLRSLLTQGTEPTVTLEGVRVDNLNFQEAGLVFDVQVTNPLPVPVPLLDFGYNLTSGEKSFLSGNSKLEGSVPAWGKKTLALPANVKFTDLLATMQGIKPGGIIPYNAALDFGFKAPGLGEKRFPMNIKGEVPVPAPPTVNIDKIDWNEVSMSEASANVFLNIANPNSFPVDVSALDFALSLAGTQVANTGVKSGFKVAEKGAQQVEVPISFSPMKFGFALFNMLKGQDAQYALDGDMKMKTRFGDMDFPIKRQGVAKFK